VELAPLCGIADRIVDLTSTGNTLRTNGLVELETIAPISARLIANKASMRLKHQQMKEIVQKFEQRKPLDTAKFCNLMDNPDSNVQYEITL